ncbi:GNAT family N-acetyltransferase [Uliginosibacterium flavum]|uniref:GNAT family N-acetyltransferase n=1 Tax=Uliginosibacterium flavum TaxID=1396831 RepID=A0ABV2TLT2_9RHOO
MNIKPICVERGSLQRYQELFYAAFGSQPKFHPDSLCWLYKKNPAGVVFGFDAYEGEKLVAHYACIPTEISYLGRRARALLSLNTATHPDYQGRGLFVKLAELTYRAAAEAGFSFVYGVANANSTPGFVRKLGFSLLEPLLARIFMGEMVDGLNEVHSKSHFFRAWDKEALTWRVENPISLLRCSSTESGLIVRGNTKGRWLPVQAELPFSEDFVASCSGLESPLRLFLGLLPSELDRKPLYFDIPDKLRPSPLNFIYRDLTGCGRKIEKGSVFFTFIDFDAY